MKLRGSWRGLPPRTGDYLASPTRPRFAYRVLEVRNVDTRVRWDAAKKAELRRLAIEVKRVPIAELPTTARVHDWDKAQGSLRVSGSAAVYHQKPACKEGGYSKKGHPS